MRKALTIGILAVAVAVMAFAGATAPRSGATPSLCHSTTLTIKAPASAKSGTRITVSGVLAQKPAHTVKATLQSRRATATKWVNGASANLSTTASYSLKWKAPVKKGKYKIRVRIAYSGTADRSAVKTVTVR
jgi:ABC-type uncharacterized transport system YnjBCD substrate-binding protein